MNIGVSNPKNVDKLVLQSKEFLEQLKATNGHAKRNTLKRKLSFIDQLSFRAFSNDLVIVMENSTKNVEKKCTKNNSSAETIEEISSLANTYAKGKKYRDSLILLKMDSKKKRCSMYGSRDCSMCLTPKGPQRPKRAFLILGKLPKLDSRLDSCEILHNRVLPRVLANKTIFIKNT